MVECVVAAEGYVVVAVGEAGLGIVEVEIAGVVHGHVRGHVEAESAP